MPVARKIYLCLIALAFIALSASGQGIGGAMAAETSVQGVLVADRPEITVVGGQANGLQIERIATKMLQALQSEFLSRNYRVITDPAARYDFRARVRMDVSFEKFKELRESYVTYHKTTLTIEDGSSSIVGVINLDQRVSDDAANRDLPYIQKAASQLAGQMSGLPGVAYARRPDRPSETPRGPDNTAAYRSPSKVQDGESAEKGHGDPGEASSIKSDVDTDIPATGVKNPNAFAVIIGNRDYESKDIPSVKYAGNDAEAVRKYLINVLGYKEGNIIYEPNATKAKFDAIFGNSEDYRGQLYDWLKKGKSDIFIYYTGHGAPDVQTRQGYFVPVDASPDNIRLSGYSLKRLYENLAKIAKDRQVPNVYVVIDACFSGTTGEGKLLLRNASPISIEVENPLLTMKNAVVLTSSNGNQVSSWYPEKGHGLFTYFFLKALKKEAEGGKKRVTANDLFSQINDDSDGLPYYARRLYSRDQTPQMQGDKTLAIIRRPYE